MMDKSSGFKSKMDKALFADATATSIGAIFGTSNTTTFVESASGIAAGGRTGLTSVVVAICFAISAFFATFVSAIPSAATAPALVVVGIMTVSYTHLRRTFGLARSPADTYIMGMSIDVYKRQAWSLERLIAAWSVIRGA